MNGIRLICQAHPSRDVSHLQARFPGLQVVTDTGAGPADTFVKSLLAAGDDPHIHFEDDIDVSSRFEELAGAAIRENPGELITFFNVKHSIRETCSLPGGGFCMNQAFYVPAGMNKAIAAFFQTWNHPTNPNDPDMLVRDFLKASRLSYICYLPCLVQHQVGKSCIDRRRSSKRQSRQFLP